MRVVAGAYGGRRLRAPRGQTTRPTSDRVREALFSTLGDAVAGAHVLDLFAGSGALGIEALSRGAADAVFVERDAAVAAVLRANLRVLGIDATVHVGDASRFVRDRLPDPTMPVFDLVLCDPPYKLSSDEVVNLLDRLGRSGQVSTTATMVAERARHSEALSVSEQELHVADVRTYGDTTLYYLRCAPRADGDWAGGA
jgi:16S rRNA (guanine966-N2)-methyltransferase